ncbi:MAG: hypothetical protein AAGJ37_08790 [Pseudomonadota bacterium]
MNYQLHTTDVEFDDKQLVLLDTLIGLNLSRFVPLIAECTFNIRNEHSNVQGNHVSITCDIELHDKQMITVSANESEINTAIRAIVERAKRHLERQVRSKQTNTVVKPQGRRP